MKLFHSLLVAGICLATPGSSQDWTGPYLGLTLSTTNSSGDHYGAPGGAPADPAVTKTRSAVIPDPGPVVATAFRSLDLDDRATLGLVGGHLWQSGNWVYGGEAMITTKPNDAGKSLAALSARVGWAQGRSLIYASLGAARYSGRFTGTAGRESLSFNGGRLALGLDQMVNDRGRIRFEVSTLKFGSESLSTNERIKPEFSQFSIGYLHQF